MTSEPDNYVTETDARASADLAHWDDRHAHIRDRAVTGVLVPPGMVAVNPDDLARLIADHRMRHGPDGTCDLCAVLAASNPTTESRLGAGVETRTSRLAPEDFDHPTTETPDA